MLIIPVPVLALLALSQVSTATLRSSRVATSPVGICVRWEANPERVAEAVVVTSSGDVAVDQKVRDSTKNVKLRRPASTSYKGQWIGMVVATSPDRPKVSVPSCAHLTKPRPTS